MARVALTDDTGALYGAVADWLTGTYAPISGSAPIETQNQGWLGSRISAVGPGGVVDLYGRDITLTSTLVLDAPVTLRNGTLRAVDTRVVLVNAPNVVLEGLTIARTGTGNADGGAAAYVQAAEFRSVNCHYSSSVSSALVLQHGTCNRSRITGGTATSYGRRQNAAGIYVSAGNLGNYGIVIDGVTVTGGADRGPDGVIVYDALGCVVKNCRIQGLRKLPDVTIPQTWTLTATTNVWESAVVRDDGPTRALFVDGTEYTEDPDTYTSGDSFTNPAPNTWSIGNGRVYLNLNGADPNTKTVVSRIVSGYGITLYCSSGSWRTMSDNRVEGNHVEDVDGFGIYLQLGDLIAVGNSTSHNVLVNTCLAGLQSDKLPFAGIGVIGGRDTTLTGDLIDTVGTSASRVPGFKHNNAFDNAGNFSTGSVIGMKVTRASASGIYINGGIYQFTNCHSANNGQSGYLFVPEKQTTVLKAMLQSCEAIDNTLQGLDAYGSGNSGANLHISVQGGYFRKGVRGVQLAGVDTGFVGGGVSFDGNSQQGINIGTGNGEIHVDGIVVTNTVGMAVDNSVVKITTGKIIWGVNSGTATTRIVGTGAGRVVDIFQTPLVTAPDGTVFKLAAANDGSLTTTTI